MRKTFFMALALFLGSCKLGPDYKAPEWSFSEQWHSDVPVKKSDAGNENFKDEWWKGFDDPALNRLIEDVAEHNHDIRIAVANIKKARALRRESRGGLLPAIGAGGNAEKQGLSTRSNSNNNNSGAKERNNFSGELDASWEIDIFGGKRRDLEVSEAALHIAEEQRRGVVLAALAELAGNYFEIRGLQKHISITERNIELLREVENLAQAQFELGVVSELDVARARGEREAMAATLPNLEAELQAGIYRISVLTGQPPETHLRLLKRYKPLPAPPDTVPVGLRSDILRRRPDVREAERNLASATAKIGVATADLFPKFSIGGAIGSSAQLFSDLFTSGAVTYTLGQNISWALFEGGALRARIAEAEAGAEEALINYERTVLEAMEDVEASLNAYGNEWRTLKRLLAAESTRREAFEIARLRYEEGEENFLVILDAERSLILAEDNVVQSETRILTSLTRLYKALGGGWERFEG